MKSRHRLKQFFTMPLFLLLLQFPSPCAANQGRARELKHLDLDFKVYSICSDDIDGDGHAEIIAGSFDGRLYVTDLGGTVLWSIDVGGLPYAVAVGDINGDGIKDIVAVVQNALGELIALEYMKGILWRFAIDRPLLSVAIGDFQADGKKEIAVGSFLGGLHILNAKNGTVIAKKGLSQESSISALAFGDIDKKAGDELVLGTSNSGVYALNQSLDVLWRLRPRIKRKKVGVNKTKKHKLHPRHKIENVQTISIEDLTGDGTKEVIVGSTPGGMVTVLNGKGDIVWHKSFPELMNNTTAASVTVGNFTGDGKQELFCLLNGVVLRGLKGTSPAILLDSAGNVIRMFHPPTAFFSLTSGLQQNQRYGKVILTSSVRGSGIDILSLENNTRSDLQWDLPGETKAKLDIWLKPRKAELEKGTKERRRFHFLYRCNYSHIYGKSQEELRQFLSPLFSLPGENAVVLTSLYEGGIENRLGKGRRRKEHLESEQIVKIAAWFEKHKIPFYLNAGKHARLYFKTGTLEKILRSAKTYCRGFIVDENNFTRTLLWSRFLHDLELVLRMLAEYPGKKLIMNEYLGFWHRFPHEQGTFERLFKSEYKNVLVPVYKPNNMKTPELNMGSLVGLWKSERIANWGVGIYADLWKWGPVFRPAPGDVLLRLTVEAMSLGANYFVFARNVSEYSENILDLAPGYKSYFVSLYDLISEQVIAPIEEPRALVISPMALQEIADPLEIERRGLGTKVYWQEIYRMKGMLDTGFLLQSTRENYLPRYCYNMSKYYDGLFPKNRNGYVTLFTEAVDPLQVQGIQQYFVVKGGHLYTRKGKVLTARKVKDFISVFDELGGSLPFRTPDAFLSAHRIKDGYKIYMINPHMFDNKDVEARLYHNLEKKEVIIRDVISGEAWPLAKGSPCSITLPAGLFRILKVHVN